LRRSGKSPGRRSPSSSATQRISAGIQQISFSDVSQTDNPWSYSAIAALSAGESSPAPGRHFPSVCRRFTGELTALLVRLFSDNTAFLWDAAVLTTASSFSSFSYFLSFSDSFLRLPELNYKKLRTTGFFIEE
jgi:hypothetical protein